jgi:hypothetical protein
MRLKIPSIDPNHKRFGCSPIIDEDTGLSVGEFWWGQHGQEVVLFDGKYVGTFKTPAECSAFAKGVEAVLSHMVSLRRPDAAELPKSEAA